MKQIFITLSTLFLAFVAYAQSSDKQMDKFISSLMGKMTFEEKLGQLNLLSQGDFVTGETRNSGFEQKLRAGSVGGVLNLTGTKRISEAQRVAVEETRLGIPLLFGFDVIHGYKTIFPIPLAQSCSWDLGAITEAASIAASEATASGLSWTFAPMVDICRDARWGRIAEGAGEDPYLGSLIARALVLGYQGDGTFQNHDKLLACLKHVALYGAAEAGLDYNTTDISRQTMYNYYFPPYKAAVEAGAGSAMSSFNDVEGIPASGNHWLQTEVLRNQWGFGGFVVSDYASISEMLQHGNATEADVASLAINAGVDMDMCSELYLNTLKEHSNTIDQACRRVLEAKYKLGLFADPYKFLDSDREKTNVYTLQNLDKAEAFAQKTFVLLKNDGNLLPLKGTERIALIGPLADSHGEHLGSWHAHGDWRQTPSLREELAKRLGQGRLLYAKGCNVYYDRKLNDNASYPEYDSRPTEQMRQEAIATAQEADVIIAVMGETAEMSGESASRSNLDMPDAQRDLLRELVKVNKPIVLLLLNGRPMSIAWEQENLQSILDVWFGGSRAASAIVSTLYGDSNPSGRLTTTFPQTVGQEPLYYNHKNTGRPLPQGQWFRKYRTNYLDVSPDPLYPFGFGLSYTTFQYGQLTLSTDRMTPNGHVVATVDVTNTGKREGVEVVQLYIHDVVSSSTRAVKELKDFCRLSLQPGETKTVSFTIDINKLKYYDYQLNYVAEPGEFEVMVGSNSRDLQTQKITLVK